MLVDYMVAAAECYELVVVFPYAVLIHGVRVRVTQASGSHQAESSGTS